MNDAKYSDDRAFGDKFMPEIKSILGRILLCTDFSEEDRKRNTDLITLTMDALRIGVRVRRNNVYYLYDDNLGCYGRDEFTIRFTKSSGCKTEFEKIIDDGFGDLFVYAIANKDETSLIKWVVIDYDAFRNFCIPLLSKNKNGFLNGRIHTVKINGDRFITFRNDEIPNGIVADSEHWVKVTA